MTEKKLIFASDRKQEIGDILVPGKDEFQGVIVDDGNEITHRVAIRIIRIATRTEYLECTPNFPASEFFYPYYYEVQTD